MVRWEEIDTQVLAAAAAEYIYRYYHPVCNVGNLRPRHVIRLQRENDITSERAGQKINSQTFSQIAHFGTKHPHSRSDVRSFLKTEFGSYELIVTGTQSKFLRSHLPFFDKVFTKCVNLLFSPSLSQVHNEIDGVGTERKARLCH